MSVTGNTVVEQTPRLVRRQQQRGRHGTLPAISHGQHFHRGLDHGQFLRHRLIVTIAPINPPTK